jgi:phosphonate degradation associated HDIG domain protein
MALTIEQITALFRVQGTVQYGSEAVSQLQHALQCAHLAERAGSAPALIAAALLHDLGHLLAPEPVDKTSGKDDLHQYVAIPFLRGVFCAAVIEPIRLHVEAKRYLCHVEKHYRAGLSSASRRSLMVQGGAFSSAQAAAFIASPHAREAVELRRWDDLAKDPAAKPPDWTHYAGILACAGRAFAPRPS